MCFFFNLSQQQKKYNTNKGGVFKKKNKRVRTTRASPVQNDKTDTVHFLINCILPTLDTMTISSSLSSVSLRRVNVWMTHFAWSIKVPDQSISIEMNRVLKRFVCPLRLPRVTDEKEQERITWEITLVTPI